MRPPWRDRRGGLSAARSIALSITILPALSMLYDWASHALGPLPLIGLVYWSGIWAAALILLTLSITPLRSLLRWNGLVDARRIIGVSALVYTLAHMLASFALFRWDWTVIFNQLATRPSLIVATTSFAGLLALGLTSWDGAVRQMGPENWKALHRANYLISPLAIAHFLLSPGIFNLQYVMLGLLLWLLAWRLLGRWTIERHPLALLLLSAAIGLLTLLGEVGWLWAYQQVPPAETFALTFSLDDGLAPPWQVLLAGTLVSAFVAFYAGPHPLLSTSADLQPVRLRQRR